MSLLFIADWMKYLDAGYTNQLDANSPVIMMNCPPPDPRLKTVTHFNQWAPRFYKQPESQRFMFINPQSLHVQRNSNNLIKVGFKKLFVLKQIGSLTFSSGGAPEAFSSSLCLQLSEALIREKSISPSSSSSSSNPSALFPPSSPPSALIHTVNTK